MITEQNIESLERWLTGRLAELAAEFADMDQVGESLDVRLCIWPDGNGRVALNYGSIDYDTEHAPICAASSIESGDRELADLKQTALELIEQACEQLADYL